MKFEHNISVIIPTFNRATTILRAIDSVISQTKKVNEIIIVDNNSTDNTIKKVVNHYSDIIILKEKKRGVSFARNTGIKNAKSEWIAFLDSDDVWYQDKIEKQLLSYNSSKKKYNLIHTNEIWKLNGRNINQKLKHMKFGGNIFEKCLPLCVISPSSVLIKKEIFKKYGLFDENLPVCEDYDLWLRITSKEEVLFINEPLVIKYGGHLDQLSKQYKIMDRFRVIALEKLLIDKRISDKQLSLTYNMLKEKIKIILNGAVKRGNLKLINFYSKKLNYWRGFFEKI